ncbi:MAG: DUF4058 family protein [Nodosilinea sp.]
MPSPFPGMDPYLEQPTFWSSVHFRLIGAMAAAIAPQILPKYYIELGYQCPVPPPALALVDQQWVDELLTPLTSASTDSSSWDQR